MNRRTLVASVSLAMAVSVPTVFGVGAGSAATDTSGAMVVKVPKGAAQPTPGSGLGTKAALDDPRCNTDEQYSVYGRWDTSSIGSGPYCVRPFDDGEKNGGATSKGVTGDAIKIVAVVPSGAHRTTLEARGGPRRRSDNVVGSWGDMVHDWLAANVGFYETWGRDIDVVMYESTGFDEAAQRADALAIAQENPFAVLSYDTFGLNTLANQLAQSKIVVNSYGIRQQELESRSPYLWGGVATDAAAVNAAEVIGKQLAGKHAEFAGSDALQETTRKFGLVQVENLIDQSLFDATLAKYGGNAAKMTTTATYVGLGDAFGDAAQAGRDAPVMVSRMKDAGVTTVVLMTDFNMNAALMAQATQQDWYPEWFMTGTGFFDLASLAQNYPEDQSAQAFGLAITSPYYRTPPELAAFSGANGVYNWFWGNGVGTSSTIGAGPLAWLLSGIHAAGPDLTPQHFKQGLFSLPASDGGPSGNPLVSQNGYGRTTGLPYDAYVSGPADYAPFWMDPKTRGLALGIDTEIEHVSWFIDGGRRYSSGTWPKKLGWFDESASVTQFDTYPVPSLTPKPAKACAAGACPSTGATAISPGTNGATEFVVVAAPASRAAS